MFRYVSDADYSAATDQPGSDSSSFVRSAIRSAFQPGGTDGGS